MRLTTNGRGLFMTGAYDDKRSGGGRLQEEARGGVNTTISQKRDAQGAGHQSEKTAMAVRAVAAATVEARAMVVAYAAVRSEATAAMTTMMTMTTTTTTLTMMTAADTSVEAAAMVTAEARAMVAAMTKEGGSVGRYVKQGEEGL